MATTLSPGDGALPATGFGPGTILVGIVGGALSLFGAIKRRFGRSPAMA
jgi:hypothetical protein